MKSFETYRREWESNAEKDAYWAVLTSSEYENKPWDRKAFFQTGIQEIGLLKEYIQQIGLPVTFQGTALHFGCGVGRLSQALGRSFQRVFGIDISENMISQAHESLPSSFSHVHYQHNPKPDLQIFASETFDFIYSNIVLQHIGKREQRVYLAEFARVLKPGGWAIIQIPSRKNCPTFLAKMKKVLVDLIPYRWKKAIQLNLLGNSTRAMKDFDFEINCCSEKEIRKIASLNGLEIQHIAYTNSCQSDFGGNLMFYPLQKAIHLPGFLSPCYFLRKKR